MARHIKVGIDIGTHQVKVVVAESVVEKDRHIPRVLGFGFAESKGMRDGYIISTSDIVQSIQSAISQAEKSSGIKVRKAFVGVGGIGLTGIVSNGSTVISRADSEVADLDINKAIHASEVAIPKGLIANRKIIHTIPIEYKVDGAAVLGRPHGMKGSKIEVKTLFVTALEHHVQDIVASLNEAGIEVEDVIASPVAASLVTLNKVQKMAGCILANIGAETVSVIVYENNIPTSLEVFPIGSNDITNDIALGLKISLEEAEDIKTGNKSNYTYAKRKLDEIIEARLSDIFELIEKHLEKIGRSELLPAGIILTGGGSGLEGIQDFARSELRLPAKIASFNMGSSLKTPIKDTTWAVAYGLCILGFSAGEDESSMGGALIKTTKKSLSEWIKQFLP